MGTDPRRPAFRGSIVESRDLSGTCQNRVRIPKNVLVAAGHALHEIERVRVRAKSKPIIEAKPRAMLKRIHPRNARFRVTFEHSGARRPLTKSNSRLRNSDRLSIRKPFGISVCSSFDS
jgi:pyruvate/2-oxoglutarate dehydrogenase complex dihydrolipoamide dehydrogenase (E3) component